jgi:RNA polymerase sigma-70 factor (ECF subfamily)
LGDRTNEQWIADLTSSGPDQEPAIEDLRAIIRSGLPYSLSKWLTPTDPHFDALADEVTQDTILRVLDHLQSFEGRSKFTTWVHKIAVRIALTELRRKRWKDVSLDELLDSDVAPSAVGLISDTVEDPALAVEQMDMVERLRRVIEEELTEKQRTALTAVGIHGMPMDEVAQRMGMKRNALYKLMHDARLRLKRRLEDEGLSPEDVLAAFGGG